MSWRIRSVVTVALLFVVLAAGGRETRAQQPIKQLMGENFQNLTVILNDLILANYQNVSHNVDSIRDHAVALEKAMPASVSTPEDRQMFTRYAASLKYTADNMLAVVDELIKRDQKPMTPGLLNIDYLRVVVAQHFGQIVTTCVLCHNQFRRVAVVK